MGYKEHKEKKWHTSYDVGKYVTTNKELKGFAKQVEDKTFGDKHFEKAYERFKQPPYGAREERNEESRR